MVEQVSGNAGLVLAGAVALGAFEAGAVDALAEKHPEIALRILRVAGTSSGALNAAVIAVGVATGRLQKAAEVLQNLWMKDGSFSTIARLPVRDWAQVWADRAHLRGLLETTELQSLVKEAIGEVMTGWDGTRHPVTLTLVTTNLNGTGRSRGPVPLPVFEQPMVFGTDALLDPASLDSVALAAAASASLPVVFAPTHVDGTPCVDGGAVNNAPISYVLRGLEPSGHDRRRRPDVDTVVVITTQSPAVVPVAEIGGTALAGRIASALIDERIAYDLAQALDANARYEDLERALDGVPQARGVLEGVSRQAPGLAALVARADLTLRSKAWNDTKVTAHHAIIPTPAQGGPRELSPTEAAVYDLIARRYLAQFFPALEYVQSELTIDLAGRRFRATGRQLVAPGWRSVLAPAPEPEEAVVPTDEPANASLPPVRPGDPLETLEVTATEKKTQPPKPFTDASIIQAMCQVAKYVSDPTIQKILRDTDGIGTPATRAAIIETLFERGYVERRKKTIVSTTTGQALIEALPEVATAPDMTAIWEAAMRAILEHQQSLATFLERIEAHLRLLVEQGKRRGPLPITSSSPARRSRLRHGVPLVARPKMRS